MVLCRISSQSRRSKVRWWPWPYWPHLWGNWRGEHKVAFNACRWNENFCRTGILAGEILGAGFCDNESMRGRRGGSAVSLQLACSMYCEDAEFRRLLPHFKIMILSIKHETLGSTLWLLFTTPANDYTAPKWVPIWGTLSPWGPFSVIGSTLGPHFCSKVPIFSI